MITTQAAYAHCRAVARREAKNFYWAFRVLPRAKSDAMCAIYAFMRRADDLSDDESFTLDQRRTLMTEWLSAWRSSRLPAAQETASDPVFVAVADAQQRFGIPQQLLEELVKGVTMDLQPLPIGENGLQTFETFEDLYAYCYLVASVVGLVCIRIFGYSNPGAERYAEETGVAFQLTNILRDVKEDADRGRLYLPLEMFREFDVPIERIHALAAGASMQPQERALLATLGVRAEKYYLAANKLLPMLDRDSHAAMWVLATIYHCLLHRIAAKQMNVFDSRVSVPGWLKLLILLRGAAMSVWNRVLA